MSCPWDQSKIYPNQLPIIGNNKCLKSHLCIFIQDVTPHNLKFSPPSSPTKIETSFYLFSRFCNIARKSYENLYILTKILI